MRDDAQVPGDVQTAHQLVGQGHNMVCHLVDAISERAPFSFLFDRTDLPLINPVRRRSDDVD